MTLRDQGFRYCLSPDRTHSRWLHPNELKATHSDWMDVTDTPTDELVALICWQDKPLPHGEAECLAVQVTAERDRLRDAAGKAIAWLDAEQNGSGVGINRRLKLCRDAENSLRAAMAAKEA